MKTYLATLEQTDEVLELVEALLEEGALPEHLSVVLPESMSDRVTDIGPNPIAASLEDDLAVERRNGDLRFATTGNPEMERSFQLPLEDPRPLFESEIGGGISTASVHDAVSGIEEMDDSQDVAEDSLEPSGARDTRSQGPRSFSEVDPEAFAPTPAGSAIRASATGIYGEDAGFGVGVMAALIPAVIPGFGVVMGDGDLASDLLAEEDQAIAQGLLPFLKAQGVEEKLALRAEAMIASGGGLVEVAAASGEASGRQILTCLDRFAAHRYVALSVP